MCEDRQLRRVWLVCALAAFALALPASADYITMGFVPISNNSGIADPLYTQFGVRVEMSTNPTFDGMAAFSFWNIGGTNANIAEIYWDWQGDLLNPLEEFAFVDPNDDAWVLMPPDTVNPDNLPGGSAPTVAFSADAGADGDSTGIWTGEPATTFYMAFAPEIDAEDRWDTLSLALLGDDDSDDATDPLLRLGLHVRSIGTSGQSDGFVSGVGIINLTPEVVPIPGAAGLGLLGMGLVALLCRMKGSASL